MGKKHSHTKTLLNLAYEDEEEDSLKLIPEDYDYDYDDSEEFPTEEANKFNQNYSLYLQERKKEIDELVEQNPLHIEEINLGDELTLYTPLRGLSRITLKGEEQPRRIRTLFGSSADIYPENMWILETQDTFTVYDKSESAEKDKVCPQIRINEPNPRFSNFACWIDMKYFEKK